MTLTIILIKEEQENNERESVFGKNTIQYTASTACSHELV